MEGLKKSALLGVSGLATLYLVLCVAAEPASERPSGAAAPGGAWSSVPEVPFEEFTLPNGLRVILHVDRKLPVVQVNQWFHVGSKNEKPGRTGFAHLFEHMMFQGSKNAPGEYFSYAENAGANIREQGVNGTTNTDRTNYFATVPSGNLEHLLWLEADRLATLLDALTPEKLDNQRDVVKNERRQNLENQPYGRAFKLMFENVFPAGHPYSWPVLGSHEDLTAATLEDVKDFFRTYYTPNNMSLVIAGDFDVTEAKRLVEKYFGGIPAGPALDRPARWVPQLSGEKIVEVHDRVAQERTYLAWPAPPFFEVGDAELQVASLILTDGLASRIQKSLVYNRQIASQVRSFVLSQEIAGMFVVIVTARPGVSLVDAEKGVTDELSRLAKEGPTAEEMNRAHTKLEYDFVSGLERIGGFGGKANLLNLYSTFLGDPGKIAEDVARFRAVTPEAVRDAVARWLDTRNRVLVRFHPEPSARASESALDRAKVPDMGADRPFQAPQVQSASLDNGLQILVVERSDLPVTEVALVTRAGSIADPAGKSGVSQLVVNTIMMGTKARKALDIENDLGNLGTALTGSAGRESVQLRFEALRRNLGPALAIFADVIRDPTFPEEEVTRERQLLLDALERESTEPNAIAARLRAMLAFGREHPYGLPSRGLPSTVKTLTREDLVEFHRAFWKPGGSCLIFVGDVNLEDARKLAQEAFGSWAGGAPPAVDIPSPKPADPTKVYVVDRQGAAQTVVMQVLLAPRRKTDDYYAFRLADMVWGGSFGSRLNLNLRESKGYAYGANSSQTLYSRSGIWFGGGGVQTDKTKESIVEFEAELGALGGTRPISELELADAKAKRIRGYAQQFESLPQIAAQIAEVWTQDLPMSELQRAPEETAKATLETVNAAARKYATPATADLLLIGDRAKIEPAVKELNLGNIVFLDSEGNPVSAEVSQTGAKTD